MKDEAKTKEQLIKELFGLRQGIADLRASDKQRSQLEEELALVDKVAQIITSTLNIDEVYEKFALELKKLLDYERLSINLIDRQAGVLTPSYLVGGDRPGRQLGLARPLEGSQTQHIIETGRTVIRADITKESRFRGELDDLKAGVRSNILVPLIIKGQVVGVMRMHSRRIGAYGPREQAILERLASQIAPALENSRLFQELQTSTQEIALVDEVAKIITSTLNIDEVYEKFALELKELVDFDRVNIKIVDLDANNYTLKYLYGPARPGHPVGTVETLENSQTQRVAVTHRTLIEDDIAANSTFRTDDYFSGMGLPSNITVPLIIRGHVTGTLSLRSRQVGAYGPREQGILERLASQIAPAVENAQLFQELQASTQEIALVDEVAGIITSTLDIDQVFNKFTEEMKKLVDFDRMAFNIIDEERKTFESRHVFGAVKSGAPPNQLLSLEGTQTQRVLATGEMLIRDNIQDLPEFGQDQNHLDAGLISSILVPLIFNGKIIATMGLRSKSKGAYGLKEQAILERLAKLIAPAVANVQVYEQVKEEMALVDEVARIITSTLDIGEVYQQFADHVKELVEFDRMVINVIDIKAGTFTLKYLSGRTGPRRPLGSVTKLAGSQNQEVLATGRTLRRGDFVKYPRFPLDREAGEMGLRSSIIVPLISKGQVVGTMCLRSRHVDVYGQREQSILERLASQITPAIENARLYQETLQSQQTLRESEEKYRNLFEDSRDALYIKDLDSRFVDVNQALLDLFGYTREELVGMHTSMLCADPVGRKKFEQEMAQKGAVRNFETLFRRKDGAELNSIVTATLWRAGDGSVLGYQGIIHDITERKAAEAALRESEERYRSLYNQTPVMMHSMERDARLVSVNNYWLETLGYEWDEVVGHKASDFLTEASRRYAEEVTIPELFITGAIHDVEYQMVKKNGEVIDVLLSAVLERDEAGEFHHTLAFIVDITERKAAEELLLANIGLTKANEAKTAFLATMSHELRTPLNSVIGFSEVLQDQTFGDLNQRQARYVNNILVNGRHLLVLINEILELSRIEAGGIELVLSQFDVREALAEALEGVRLISAGKEIEMTVEVEAGLPAIFADESKFKQVVYNLVGNAIEFTPEGGRINLVASSVQGGLAEPNQAVPEIRISISDTGIGIKPEDQERIFEAFEQVDSSSTREQGGAGLGLTLTRRLVELHGGRIWVESEGIEGKGSTFTFLLPVKTLEGEQGNLDQSG